jgi:hypothetical protein
MATDVETLLVRMEARITEFEKAMARAQRTATTTTGKINATFAAMNKKLVSGFKSLAGGFIGITALTQIPKLIGDVVDEASRLVDTADKIGITTEELQRLEFAAKQTGVEISELGSGLSFFGKQLGEASRGQGELLEIFKANGVALRDAEGNMRPLMDLFFDFANLVKNAASQQERLLLVTKGLGRANDELAVTLGKGSSELRRLGDEATIAGDKQLRQVEETGDRLGKLMDAIGKTFQRFVLSRVDEDVDDLVTAIEKLDDEDVSPWERFLRLLQAIDRATATNLGGLTAPQVPPSPTAPGKTDIDPLGKARRDALEKLQEQLFEIQHAVPTVLPGAGDDAKKKIDETIKALEREAKQLGLTGLELARYEALTRAGIDANHAMAPAVIAAADAAFQAEQAQEKFNAQIAAGIEAADALRDALAESMRTLIDGLIEGKSAAEAFGNVLNQIANRLLDKGIQLVIDALLGTGGTSAGGIIGSALFGGGRQHGGPVSKGQGYVVGESGPELFVPNVSGRIVPGAAGAGGRVMVDLFLADEIDARIRRVSGPQAERISVAVTRANNAASQRQQELRG